MSPGRESVYRRASWRPVLGGKSGAIVHRAGDVYRKETPDAEREAAALIWLRAHGLPAAEVLDLRPGQLFTRAVPGRPASDPWPEPYRQRVVDALAEFTLALHRLPSAGCPFDRTLPVTVAEARRAVEAGTVDLDDLNDAHRGWSAGRLLDALEEQAPSMRDREVPAVTHGDWCLPNILLDADSAAVTGIIDAGRAGLADRHVDLALMSRSLASRRNPQYSRADADRFLERTGYDPGDHDKLDFYRLLDEFF